MRTTVGTVDTWVCRVGDSWWRGDGASRRTCCRGGVGAVVASALGGSGEPAVLVSGAKVCHEGGEGFVGFGLGAPVAAWHFKESGGVNDVVAKTDDGGRGWFVIAGGGKANAIVELGEEFVDGGWWVPGGSHAEGVGIELDLSDLAPSCPKVGQDFEAGGAT